MKNTVQTKTLSLLIALAMLLSLVPGVSLTAYAAEPINLSTLTDNYTANDGDVLTGTLGGNYKISIADGATVTLNDVTINGTNDTNCRWAGITCEGDAIIILSGTNIVKGFYRFYPGISVPVAKTLTIKGSGSLTASPCDDRGTQNSAAGIGAFYQSSKSFACGNIVIEGGTINATGGQYGAGIGGAWYNGCGNITITGGTVTATGGGWAPGIGGGFKTGGGNITITGGTITATGGKNCPGIGANDGSSATVSNLGDITITDGVTSVTATGGNSAPYSIGASKNCSCGTITIGGTVTGNISTNPYTYPLPHTHSFTYSADGATITATCGEGCDITEGLTLTISAPTGDLTADGTKTFPATLSTGYNTTAFPGTYAITYTKDGAEFTGTPTEAGEYTASVTVGTATASVSYTVAAPEPTVGADGLSITVSNAGEFKYIIVISGEYDNYKDIKTNKDKAAYYYGISAAKLEQAGGSYAFAAPADGTYTLCIRLADGTDKIYTVTVAAPVPPTHTFDVEVAGTVVTFTTDSEIKMLRFALGEGITDMTAMRAAAGVRGFTGSRFANGSFTMTVLPAGTYSYAVEYTDGIQEFGEFTVEENASKTPIITAEGVTGNWSLIARIKYAPGTITDPADFHGVAGLRVLYAPAEGSTATYRKGVLTGEYSFVVIYTDGTYELINKTF